MATIPIYRQQTDVSAVPNMGRVDPSAAGAVAGAIGDVSARLTGQLAQYAEEKRQEFDTLRAEDAYNKLRERQMSLMLDPEKGFSAQKSKHAARPGFTDEYVDHFNKAQSEIGATLSEQQRKLFNKRASTASLEYRNALMRHVLAESNNYAQEVFDGTLKVETNRAATEWNNPYTVQASMERIESAVAMRAKREGLAADATDALLRDARSKVHAIVVASALENGNVGYAERYLKANGGQMNAMDALKVQGLVKREADTRFALGTATEVVQSMQQQANPDDMGRLAALVEQRESGGRADAVSPKGARGLMQLMPATAREMERKLGMAPGQTDTDPAANRQAGQAYLADMLQMFQGDVTKALAAYNAGPGRVQKALKEAKANPALGEGGEDWLALLPKETQDYVAAIAAQFSGGGGTPARPTQDQILAAVRERVGTSNPERLKLAQDEAMRQWRAAEDGRKQREDEALGEAFRVLEANGGRWDALRPKLLSLVSGEKLPSLREYASKVAKGDPVKTDWDVYYTLRSDPRMLVDKDGKPTNLLALKHKLAEQEFKELTRQQEELLNGTANTSQLQTTHQRMSMRFSEMGVDSSPKQGSGDAKKVAQVWSMLDQRVRAAEAALARKLKPEEMDAQIDSLFATVEVKGKLWGTNTRRAFELEPGDEKQIVVPDADRKQIMAALQKTGQPVTEERVMFYYKRARGLE